MIDRTIDLTKIPLHLGLGATIVAQEPMTGDMAWYERYGARHGDDGIEGRLVAIHDFAEPWTSWEVHPHGHELVLCMAGRITLHQQLLDGTTRTTVLAPGQAVINEPGVWHTADTDGPATALFITAGAGTTHKPR